MLKHLIEFIILILCLFANIEITQAEMPANRSQLASQIQAPSFLLKSFASANNPKFIDFVETLAHWLESYTGHAANLEEMMADLEKAFPDIFFELPEINARKEAFIQAMQTAGMASRATKFSPAGIRLVASLRAKALLPNWNGNVHGPVLGNRYLFYLPEEPWLETFVQVCCFYHPETGLQQYVYLVNDLQSRQLQLKVFTYYATGFVLTGEISGALGATEITLTGDVPKALESLFDFIRKELSSKENLNIITVKRSDSTFYLHFQPTDGSGEDEDMICEVIYESNTIKVQGTQGASLIQLTPVLKTGAVSAGTPLETAAERELFWRRVTLTNPEINYRGQLQLLLQTLAEQEKIQSPIFELGGGDAPLSAVLWPQMKVVSMHLGAAELPVEMGNLLIMRGNAEDMSLVPVSSIGKMRHFLQESHMTAEKNTWLHAFPTIIISNLLNFVSLPKIKQELEQNVAFGTRVIIQNALHKGIDDAVSDERPKNNADILRAFSGTGWKIEGIFGFDDQLPESGLNPLSREEAETFTGVFYLVLQRFNTQSDLPEDIAVLKEFMENLTEVIKDDHLALLKKIGVGIVTLKKLLSEKGVIWEDTVIERTALFAIIPPLGIPEVKAAAEMPMTGSFNLAVLDVAWNIEAEAVVSENPAGSSPINVFYVHRDWLIETEDGFYTHHVRYMDSDGKLVHYIVEKPIKIDGFFNTYSTNSKQTWDSESFIDLLHRIVQKKIFLVGSPHLAALGRKDIYYNAFKMNKTATPKTFVMCPGELEDILRFLKTLSPVKTDKGNVYQLFVKPSVGSYGEDSFPLDVPAEAVDNPGRLQSLFSFASERSYIIQERINDFKVEMPDGTLQLFSFSCFASLDLATGNYQAEGDGALVILASSDGSGMRTNFGKGGTRITWDYLVEHLRDRNGQVITLSREESATLRQDILRLAENMSGALKQWVEEESVKASTIIKSHAPENSHLMAGDEMANGFSYSIPMNSRNDIMIWRDGNGKMIPVALELNYFPGARASLNRYWNGASTAKFVCFLSHFTRDAQPELFNKAA